VPLTGGTSNTADDFLPDDFPETELAGGVLVRPLFLIPEVDSDAAFSAEIAFGTSGTTVTFGAADLAAAGSCAGKGTGVAFTLLAICFFNGGGGFLC
jgi:hypothetical protein